MLSICSFRYVRDGLDDAALDALNRALVRRLHVETPYVPSPTLVRGRVVVRPCFINPRTADDDVDAMVAAVRPDRRRAGLVIRTAAPGVTWA